MLVIGVAAAGAGAFGGGDDGGTTGGTTGDGDETAQLAVTVVGPGSVSSEDGAIGCRPACEAPVARGSEVVLAATARAGADFRGWSGGSCTGTGECRLTIERDTVLTARFAATPVVGERRALAIAPEGDGEGSVTGPPGSGLDCPAACRATFPAGTTSVTLRAAAQDGSTFAGWAVGACPGAGETCSVALSGPLTTVRPRFDKATPREQGTLYVQFGNAGHGRVSSDPAGLDCRDSCRRPFDKGTAVTLQATSDDGWVFAGWKGAGCAGTGTCSLTIGDRVTRVVASFAPVPVTTTTATVPDIG